MRRGLKQPIHASYHTPFSTLDVNLDDPKPLDQTGVSIALIGKEHLVERPLWNAHLLPTRRFRSELRHGGARHAAEAIDSTARLQERKHISGCAAARGDATRTCASDGRIVQRVALVLIERDDARRLRRSNLLHINAAR